MCQFKKLDNSLLSPFNNLKASSPKYLEWAFSPWTINTALLIYDAYSNNLVFNNEVPAVIFHPPLLFKLRRWYASNRVNRVRLACIKSYLEAIFLPTKRKNEAKKPQI